MSSKCKVLSKMSYLGIQWTGSEVVISSRILTSSDSGQWVRSYRLGWGACMSSTEHCCSEMEQLPWKGKRQSQDGDGSMPYLAWAHSPWRQWSWSRENSTRSILTNSGTKLELLWDEVKGSPQLLRNPGWTYRHLCPKYMCSHSWVLWWQQPSGNWGHVRPAVSTQGALNSKVEEDIPRLAKTYGALD